jgi:hypothetical protein
LFRARNSLDEIVPKFILAAIIIIIIIIINNNNYNKVGVTITTQDPCAQVEAKKQEYE